VEEQLDFFSTILHINPSLTHLLLRADDGSSRVFQDTTRFTVSTFSLTGYLKMVMGETVLYSRLEVLVLERVVVDEKLLPILVELSSHGTSSSAKALRRVHISADCIRDGVVPALENFHTSSTGLEITVSRPPLYLSTQDLRVGLKPYFHDAAYHFESFQYL
jgi:hypothetical protein